MQSYDFLRFFLLLKNRTICSDSAGIVGKIEYLKSESPQSPAKP